jgi:hypothetical protein
MANPSGHPIATSRIKNAMSGRPKEKIEQWCIGIARSAACHRSSLHLIVCGSVPAGAAPSERSRPGERSTIMRG